ncbi:MAG: alpha/beta fold hydrolase [Rubrobacteraceae bacterium]
MENPLVELDPIVGRYARVQRGEDLCRVYFEEAGRGKPLVCLHTAGADSRQWHGLLLDPGVTRGWRAIAFDLPYHGRTLPPEGWWEKEYLLTTDDYSDFVMTFIRELGLEQPVVLGCSMGGSIVLELARRYPEELDAVIGLSGASNIEGRFGDWSVRPDVNGAPAVAEWTYGLMAPQSPEASKREVWWIYSQGGPGVYRGDTYFYSVDWNLRGREPEIDTSRCPVHLLTGEYDYACSAEESEATARAIPGAEFTKMTGIGHFPMTENYPLFSGYLLPVLALHKKYPYKAIICAGGDSAQKLQTITKRRGPSVTPFTAAHI